MTSVAIGPPDQLDLRLLELRMLPIVNEGMASSPRPSAGRAGRIRVCVSVPRCNIYANKG